MRLGLSPQRRATLVGLGFVLLSAGAYGITPALVELSYRAHLDELSLIGLRSVIAAALVWAVARANREPRLPPRTAIRLAGLGACLYGPQMWLYFAALRYLDTAVAVAVVYVYPAIVAVLVAARLRRPPPAGEVTLIGVALLGIATITVSVGPSRAAPLGLALVLAAALGYAAYVVITAGWTAHVPTLGAASWVLVGTAACTLAGAALTGQLAVPASALAWSYLLIHGLVVVPVGLVAFYAGLRRLGPARTALADTVQPVVAVVAGMVLLGEELTLPRALGIALVILAVAGMPVLSARSAVADRHRSPSTRQLSL